MTIERLKAILSGVSAMILIVPVAMAFEFWSFGVPLLFYDSETGMITVDRPNDELQRWITLAQYLLIGAPFLVNEHWLLRLPAIAVYVCGAIYPVKYVYLYIADGVYQRIGEPVLNMLPGLLGLTVTTLYLVAFLMPTRRSDPEESDETV